MSVNDNKFKKGKIGLISNSPAKYRFVEVLSTKEENGRIEKEKTRYLSESLKLQRANPSMVAWKKIKTNGFGVGRNLRFGDLNGDGQIDGNEWEEARNDATTQVYAESLADASANRETVVIEKPRFGFLPFIVADSEKGLVRHLMFRTGIFLAGAMVTMGFGIRLLLNLFR